MNNFQVEWNKGDEERGRRFERALKIANPVKVELVRSLLDEWAKIVLSRESDVAQAAKTVAGSPAIPPIHGVDFLDSPAPGAKRLSKPFYSDQISALVEMARRAREAAPQGSIFISPSEGGTFSLYKRPKASKEK